jgi:hypothetical protein
MDRIYVCIRGGVVVDLQHVTDETPFIDDGFSFVFDVTGADPMPEIGWKYDKNQIHEI